MPITIGSNIASLSAQRRLADGTNQLSKTFERLSSGQRINKAADDAAGLAISESLKSDRRVFNQGIRNFNDGVSLLNIADGALESLSNITIRLKELAEQSANGTYSSTQRKAIDKEAQALSKEFTRIAQTTKFNGVSLLNGNLSSGIRLQGGFGTDGSIFSSLGGAIGNGSFTFSQTINVDSDTFVSPGDIVGVQFGDLNGDGVQDMVTAESAYGGNGGYLMVHMGNGDGTFNYAKTYGDRGSYSVSSINATTLNISDINNDGILDMIGSSAQGHFVSFIGKGDGTFNSGSSVGMLGTSVSDIETADINGDGNLDIFVSSATQVVYRLGAGNGTFGATNTISARATAIQFADLNNDGTVDLLAGGSNLGGKATVFLGNGSGSFGSAVTYDMQATFVTNIEAADLNGDNILDIISSGFSGTNKDITVRLGNADGTFGASASFSLVGTSGTTPKLALGDFNGDGILDAAAASDKLDILLGAGDGTFGASRTYSLSNTQNFAIATGDINGDGVYDIATGGEYNGSFMNGNVVSGTGALLEFDLKTLAGARQALPVFDQKIQQLAKQRGQIGAFQSRVQVGINNLQTASENYAAAESRIRDADIADESSKLTRLNILQQAAASVLAQANQQPLLALNLLRS